MEKGREVKVVELDFESVAYLRELPHFGRKHHRRWLSEAETGEAVWRQTFVLTGNYPYNISSQSFKMLTTKDLIPCCTGMIQKEVAERIAAGPGSKTYGNIWAFWFKHGIRWNIFYPYTNMFQPAPSKKAVIRMTRNETKNWGATRGCSNLSWKPLSTNDEDFAEFHLFNFRKRKSVEQWSGIQQTPGTVIGTEFIELTNRVETALKTKAI